MNDREFIDDIPYWLHENWYYAMGKLKGRIEAFKFCKDNINYTIEVCDINIKACSELLDKGWEKINK